MCALALSADRRYLAVSERGERSTITVLDLHHEQGRKRQVLTAGDVPAQEFVCMAFSPDSKYLIGQTGPPEWTLIFWLWEKHKVLAAVKTSSSSNPVNQVSPAWSTITAGAPLSSSDLPVGELQPIQQRAALRERNRRLQAAPLRGGVPEAEQRLQGGVHQLPEPLLGGPGARGGGHGHGTAAGVRGRRAAEGDGRERSRPTGTGRQVRTSRSFVAPRAFRGASLTTERASQAGGGEENPSGRRQRERHRAARHVRPVLLQRPRLLRWTGPSLPLPKEWK